jgi:hypothetical protein
MERTEKLMCFMRIIQDKIVREYGTIIALEGLWVEMEARPLYASSCQNSPARLDAGHA